MLVTRPPPARAAALVAYGTAVGVLVDLDHFLLARLHTGRWGAVRRVLERPAIVLVDRDAIFDEGEVGKLRRLLSHSLLAGVLVLAAAGIAADLAGVTAAVMYAHVVADLVHDVREFEGPIDAAP